MTFGAEKSETFSGTVTGETGNGYPEGTVTVQSGATTLCSETLPAGSGDSAGYSCSPTNGSVLAASATAYPITATFTPGTTSSSISTSSYTTSTSTPAQSLTVNASTSTESTTTSLSAVTSPLTYGAETAETFSGTVTGHSGDGYPEGTVTLYDGSTPVELCAETLPAGSGDSAGFSCSLTANQLAVGTYSNVDAVFSPGGTSSSNSAFVYTTSTSTPAQSFTVKAASASTTTSLGLSSPSVTFGAEKSETFSGTVTGHSRRRLSRGDGDRPKRRHRALQRDSAGRQRRQCRLQLQPDQRVGAGGLGHAYPITATFAPGTTSSSSIDFTYTTSTSSPAQSLTVNAATSTESTTTSLNAVTSPVTYGAETTETFSGTVTGHSGDGYPEGTVTLYDGSTPVELCAETLPAGSGDSAGFSCALTANQLDAGSYSNVDAVFSPGGTSSSDLAFVYTTSTSTPTQSFTVKAASASTTTSLNLSSPSLTVGSESSEIFSGTVTGHSGDGYPQGTVTVQSGATVLCSEVLPSGSGDSAGYSCSPTNGSVLAASATPYPITATFAPGTTSSSSVDYSYTTSTSSPAQNLTVNASSSATSTTTSLNAVTSPITYGAETAETFSGTVTGHSGDGYPKGTVTVKNGTTILCSETLPSGSGDSASYSCALTATQLAVGIYSSVDAVFIPASPSSSSSTVSYTTSTSTPVKSVTVNRATKSTTTTLHPVTSPITVGAETAETFSGTVTGQSGDGYPEGTVTVKNGTTTLCSETLPSGSGDSTTYSCSLTASELNAGTYSSVDAVFTPGTSSSSNADFSYTGSTSTPRRPSR